LDRNCLQLELCPPQTFTTHSFHSMDLVPSRCPIPTCHNQDLESRKLSGFQGLIIENYCPKCPYRAYVCKECLSSCPQHPRRKFVLQHHQLRTHFRNHHRIHIASSVPSGTDKQEEGNFGSTLDDSNDVLESPSDNQEDGNPGSTVDDSNDILALSAQDGYLFHDNHSLHGFPSAFVVSNTFRQILQYHKFDYYKTILMMIHLCCEHQDKKRDINLYLVDIEKQVPNQIARLFVYTASNVRTRWT